MGEVSTSEADQIADQIVAQNIQDQQATRGTATRNR